MTMKDLPITKRPIEKLHASEKQALSDAELLALLLGTGTRKYNAVQLAQTLLRRYNLEVLSQIKPKDLTKIPGVGKTKAARIVAAVELGYRLFAPQGLARTVISSPADIIREVRDITTKNQEYLIVLYLNARNELIQKEVIGVGSTTMTLIEPKQVFAPALTSPCDSIVIVHNHPSGNPSPSDADIAFTKRMQEASEVMGIRLHDHVIVSSHDYFSFLTTKVLPMR